MKPNDDLDTNSVLTLASSFAAILIKTAIRGCHRARHVILVLIYCFHIQPIWLFSEENRLAF